MIIHYISIFIHNITDDNYNISIFHFDDISLIIFIFSSTYIQSFWVLKQATKHQSRLIKFKMEQNLYDIENSNNNKIIQNKSTANNFNIKMVDILRNKFGFTAFMRHCRREMCPEGLLFIAKVAHYKAKIQQLQLNTIPKSILSKNIQIDDDINDDIDVDFDNNDAHINIPETEKLPTLRAITPRGQFSFDQDIFEANILSHDWMTFSHQIIEPQKLNKGMHMSSNNSINIINEDIDNIFNNISKIYNYGKHLFLKYIDVDGEYSINISYKTRKELLLFFSKKKDIGFNYILNKNEIIKTYDDTHQNNILIQTHLYHIFDIAVAETWDLLEKDTYLRFQHTIQYLNFVQNLTKKH